MAASIVNVLRKLCEIEKEVLQLKDHQVAGSDVNPAGCVHWLEPLKVQPELWTGPPLVVLSLFDGIGGVWAALDLLGIPWRGYSSEINADALQLLKARHPTVQHVGDVLRVQKSHIKEKVDLIIGGFPCQDLSAMGKKIGLHGTRSRLFFEMLRVIDLFKPTWFLVENVASMFWIDRDEISTCLKCQPLEIDSQEITASKRRRLYWTNLPLLSPMPNLKHHYSTSLQSILEDATALELKSGCVMLTNFYPGMKCQLRAVIDNKTNTLRYINTTELEKLMGYPVGYTDINYKKGKAKSPPSKKRRTKPESNKIRWSLLGNTFSVPVIAYLLHSLADKSVRNQPQCTILPEAVREEDSTVMRVGEIWALYNSRKMPNWYAEIESRTGGRFSQGEDKKLKISVRFLELAPLYLKRETDQWSPTRGTGLYDCHSTLETQDCWIAFSHRVTSYLKMESGYFIYPGKHEIWAVYCPAAKNHYFVYIVESQIPEDLTYSSVKPDREKFQCSCRVLQETDIPNTYRLTDMAFPCTNLSIFAFRTPYVYKNGRDLFRLETNGIRGYRHGTKKNGSDTSEDEDEPEEADEEDEAEAPETPQDTEEPELTR